MKTYTLREANLKLKNRDYERRIAELQEQLSDEIDACALLNNEISDWIAENQRLKNQVKATREEVVEVRQSYSNAVDLLVKKHKEVERLQSEIEGYKLNEEDYLNDLLAEGWQTFFAREECKQLNAKIVSLQSELEGHKLKEKCFQEQSEEAKKEQFYALEKNADLAATLGELVEISSEIVEHIRGYDFPVPFKGWIIKYDNLIERLLKERNNGTR